MYGLEAISLLASITKLPNIFDKLTYTEERQE